MLMLEDERHAFTYDNYTSLWNMLDYCATTMPVTVVKDTDEETVETESRNSIEEVVRIKSKSPWMCSAEWKANSHIARSASQVGLPVSVQLVGRRLNEENLLAITEACDEALARQRTGVARS